MEEDILSIYLEIIFFPKQTKSLVCLVGWNSIRGYTRLQKLNKKYILPFYKRNIITPYNNFTGNKPDKYPFLLIKNGKEIKQYKKLKELQNATDVPSYDFILHTYYSDDDDENENYTIRYNEISEKSYYQKSKCSFIAIELKYEDKTYQIDLNNPFNFLVKDNELLDYPFLRWYTYKHYNVDISQNYIVELIDSSVTSETLSVGHNIKLSIDGWEKEEHDISDSEDYEEAKENTRSILTSIQSYFFTIDDNNKEK